MHALFNLRNTAVNVIKNYVVLERLVPVRTSGRKERKQTILLNVYVCVCVVCVVCLCCVVCMCCASCVLCMCCTSCVVCACVRACGCLCVVCMRAVVCLCVCVCVWFTVVSLIKSFAFDTGMPG